jgi:hypothetical protein
MLSIEFLPRMVFGLPRNRDDGLRFEEIETARTVDATPPDGRIATASDVPRKLGKLGIRLTILGGEKCSTLIR